MATVLENQYIPRPVREGLSVPQAEFLSYEGREALYGGAAGGGKSVALLAGALQYAGVPGYHALLLRRTFKMLEKPGALLDMSREWLAGTPARWNEQKHRWSFPSGASLTFGHMEHASSVYNFQGANYHYVGYDELTQFEEPMYRYLFSRTRRRAGDRVPVRVRAASNPGGTGHDFVKQRFVTAPPSPDRIFIPAKLDDNPHIDRAEYVASLGNLDPLTLAQLLAGDWDAVAGGRFDRRWFRPFLRRGDHIFLDGRPVEGRLTAFLTVDTAASTKASADRTVLSVWGSTACNQLLWLDCVAGRWEVPDVLPLILRVARQWQAGTVWIESVAAHSGTAVFQGARREKLAAAPFTPDGDKLNNAFDAIVLASTGRVWVPEPRPPWLEDALGELSRFTGDPAKDAHDDVVDTLAQAARVHLGKAVMGGVGMPWVKRG